MTPAIDGIRRTFLVATAVLLSVLACGGEQAHWERIAGSEDPNEVREFLSKYPEGELRSKALDRLQELEWQAAVDGDSVEGYRNYLESYPSGRFSDEARYRSGTADETATELITVTLATRFVVATGISPHLDDLLARNDISLRSVKVTYPRATVANQSYDSLTMSLPSDEWTTVDVEYEGGGLSSIPTVAFRRGEIGSRGDRTYSSEGAEARIGDDVFEYRDEVWVKRPRSLGQ